MNMYIAFESLFSSCWFRIYHREQWISLIVFPFDLSQLYKKARRLGYGDGDISAVYRAASAWTNITFCLCVSYIPCVLQHLLVNTVIMDLSYPFFNHFHFVIISLRVKGAIMVLKMYIEYLIMVFFNCCSVNNMKYKKSWQWWNYPFSAFSWFCMEMIVVILECNHEDQILVQQGSFVSLSAELPYW